MSKKYIGFHQKESSDCIRMNSSNIYFKHSVAQMSAAFKHEAEGMVYSKQHHLT